MYASLSYDQAITSVYVWENEDEDVQTLILQAICFSRKEVADFLFYFTLLLAFLGNHRVVVASPSFSFLLLLLVFLFYARPTF